jgi:predicted RNA binding protein YcfA (HicA-like mRNA interferase family)
MGERWPSMKARQLLAALLRVGWTVVHSKGSHRKLAHPGRDWVEFAFHDSEEIGPRMVAKIAKETGLRREDL